MITQDLEAKVIDAIDAALKADAATKTTAYQIFGAWSVTPGVVKAVQQSNAVALLSVALSLPVSQTYTTPAVTFNGSIALTVRFELDPTGNALASFASVLADIFRLWQSETYQQAFTALDLPTLSVDEVAIGASEPPRLDTADQTFSITLPFTLSGSYRPDVAAPPTTTVQCRPDVAAQPTQTTE